MSYTTDIRVVRKGTTDESPRASAFRHASTRRLSDKEIESVKEEAMIGLDPSKYEIKEY